MVLFVLLERAVKGVGALIWDFFGVSVGLLPRVDTFEDDDSMVLLEAFSVGAGVVVFLPLPARMNA